ncbi:CPBP family intramembrane metalloprotease [Ligilactobacillus salivarius]|uniref:Membrane-bound protease, CAAX family n=2 Tax=Ligilactobacillus salivarius TaxID=1624 RepID=V6DN22_9LACO|nr:CPBP family intramembrane glutamic endopeptidase [Ligilactobacillus salivarius]CDK35423.1 membrane-bound protease, CAAX family [Ligilactobacillus salivarius cp400]ARU18516.1 CPBP family intramembrane metalloprotease [Ligilactobacillus salivarius]MCF2623263.1 CPBP family intramembrane metalloprotease [Ligilactobacillus salivarius]PAY54380.1 immunity protein [Ligilactobacillus salivarius]PAY60010.1 immunity protein [Ligilactobacillus salivarius]
MEKKTFVIPVGLVGLYAVLLVISGRIVQLLSLNSSNSKTFASVIINFVICALFLWLNKKYIGVKIDFKFTFSFFKRHIILATVLAIITILIVIGNVKNLPLALMVSLQAGIVEEVICRGIISKYIYNDLNKVEEKRRIWISAISSGLAFGMLHFINLFRQGLLPTINQVIAAVAIGMLFGVIYLVYKNLFGTIFIHFLNDFWIIAVTGTITEQDSGTIAMIISSVLYWIILGFIAWRIIKKKVA